MVFSVVRQFFCHANLFTWELGYMLSGATVAAQQPGCSGYLVILFETVSIYVYGS